jgi:hypothetical protein
MNGEMHRIWKEAIMIYINARSHQSPEETEENQRNLGSDSVGLTEYARYEFHLVSMYLL